MGLFTNLAIVSTVSVIILSALVLLVTDLSNHYSVPIDDASYTAVASSQSSASARAAALTNEYQITQDQESGINEQASDTAQLQSLIGTQASNKNFVEVLSTIWQNFLRVVSVDGRISALIIGMLTIAIGAGIFALWRQQTP